MALTLVPASGSLCSERRLQAFRHDRGRRIAVLVAAGRRWGPLRMNPGLPPACKTRLRRPGMATGASFGPQVLGVVTADPVMAGAVAVTAALGSLFWVFFRRDEDDSEADGQQKQVSNSSDRENAVLVFGATGKLGKQVVASCVAAGRHVVATGRRDEQSLGELYQGIGIKAGKKQKGGGMLHLAAGCDITKPSTLNENIFQGVTQIICAAGPRFAKLDDGSMGFPPGSRPEDVDLKGVVNILAAADLYLPAASSTVEEVVSLRMEQDLQCWRRLDDVIMGGQSSSQMSIVPADETCISQGTCAWRGELILEGGGFCGVRSDEMRFDFKDFDGVMLRVKAAGQRFKLNLKTDEQAGVPESTYQACFNTENGDWTKVYLPWHEFRCVKRASFNPDGPPLDPSRIRQIGLVYSRFEFNGLANPFYNPGNFELLIDGGIKGYKNPRPQFIQLSSAGVERNAYIADNAEARANDIPIIKANPGGILNYKYEGEQAIRASRFAYTIVRPTGLDMKDDNVDRCRILEAQQGDTITGKVSRFELAQIAVAALSLPQAVGKTFELRQAETEDAKSKYMSDSDMNKLFLSLHTDWDRARFGVRPLPKAFPYDPPEAVTGDEVGDKDNE